MKKYHRYLLLAASLAVAAFAFGVSAPLVIGISLAVLSGFALVRRFNRGSLTAAVNTAPTMPATAFDSTKIARISKSFAVFTPTGGSAVTIVGKIMEADAKTTVIERKVPDAAGINRADSHFATEATEDYVMTDIEEIDSVLSLIGGFTGLVHGNVQFFLRDPRDATNTVRFLSDAFPCSVQRDGNVKFSGDAVSKNPSLKFLSEKSGPVTWTPAGATA